MRRAVYLSFTLLLILKVVKFLPPMSCNTFILDFDKIQTGLKKRPTLDGKNLSIKIVPVSKTILVKNLPASATYDSVLHKFKNKRAGGGEIERVDLDLKKRIALVEFKDARGRRERRLYFHDTQ